MGPWKTISSEYVLDVPWLRVRREVCRLPDGSLLDDYYIWEGSDWVTLFALTEKGTVLLVRQYRHAIGRSIWELPGGLIDPGEEVVAAALRELSEETGYRADRAEAIARLSADPPKATFYNHLVVAWDCRPAGPQHLDHTEAIALHDLPPAQLLEWVRQGEIYAQTSVSCIYLALDRLGLWPAPAEAG